MAVLVLAGVAWFLYGAMFSRRYPRKQQHRPATPPKPDGSSRSESSDGRE